MNVCEIFPSFQGEGVLAGVAQVFLRLGGCNLGCSYCDTPWARSEADACRVYGWTRKLATVPNPLDAAELLERVTSLWGRGMHSLSLTGGEPLLQAEELAELLPALRREGMPVYLETNGTLPEALAMVLDWVDWVAMDLKLPYSQGGADYLDAQRDFLRLASARHVFLKVVIEEETPPEELEWYLRGMGAAGGVPLVLQPVSVAARGGARGPHGPRHGGGRGALWGRERDEGMAESVTDPGAAVWKIVGISAERAAELLRLAVPFFDDVRVIPQLHRAWGIR